MNKKFFLKLRFSLKERISIYQKLAAFLESGIAIKDAVEAIRDRARKNKDYKSKILDDWLENLNEGYNVSASIKEWIPSSEFMLISAGERGVGVIKGFQEAAILSLAAKKNKSAIVKSSIQPVFLVLALSLMLCGFQIKMVPIFTNILPISRWPSGAQLLESVSGFVYSNIIFIIIGFILLGLLISWSMGNWTSSIRYRIFDRIPPWSIYRGYQSSSFLIGLSSLMKAGISLNESLKTIHKNSSKWAQLHLETMISSLKRATKSHGEALDTGMLDKETAGDVEDYSRLGSFQDAIHRMGRSSIEEGIEIIEGRMAVIKNIMLALVGLSLMWIYYTTYSLQTTVAGSVGG